MKNSYRLFLVLLLATAAPTLNAQTSTADSLVQKIFASFQEKDEKAFIKLYPNPQQLTRFMRIVMEQAFQSEEMKAMMALDEKTKNINIDSLINVQITTFSSQPMMEKMQKEIGETFRSVIEKGEKKGVKWNQAKLTGFTIDSSVAKGDNAEAYEKLGVKEVRGVIDFSVGDSAYQMSYNKMLYLEKEGGWFGAEFPQLARKGESLEPDRTADEEVSLSSMEKAENKKTTDKKQKTPAAKKSNTKTAVPRKKA